MSEVITQGFCDCEEPSTATATGAAEIIYGEMTMHSPSRPAPMDKSSKEPVLLMPSLPLPLPLSIVFRSDAMATGDA